TTLLFDLSSSATGPGNDMILMNGGVLGVTGTQNFQFNLINNALGNGTYTLVTGGTSTTASSSGLSSNIPSGTRQTIALGRSSTVTTGTNYIQLVVSGTPAASLIWSGMNGSNWDVNTTANWSGGTFYNLDTVTFNDTSSNGI